MNCELTVTIKDQERKKLIFPHNVYDTVVMDPDHPVLKQLIDDSLKEFKGEIKDIIITAKMYLK